MASKNRNKALICVAAVVVVAIVAVCVTKCKKSAPKEELVPKTTQEMANERLSDPVYFNKLESLRKERDGIVAKRNAAIKEFENWQAGWVLTNAAAKTITDELRGLHEHGQGAGEKARELEDKLDALAKADPEGSNLFAVIEKASEEIKFTTAKMSSTIGERILQQSKENMAAEEAASRRFVAAQKKKAEEAAKKAGKAESAANTNNVGK